MPVSATVSRVEEYGLLVNITTSIRWAGWSGHPCVVGITVCWVEWGPLVVIITSPAKRWGLGLTVWV